MQMNESAYFMSTNHPLRQRCTRGLHPALMFTCILLAGYPASEIPAQTGTAESEDAMPANVGMIASSADEGSALTATNANAVLNAVLDVITGQIYNEQFFTLHGFIETIVPTSTDYLLQTARDSYESKMYDCPEGGNADITQRLEENGKFDNSKYEFVDCSWEDFLINGESSEFKTDFGEFRNHFDALSLVDAEGQQSTLTGFFSRTIINDYGTGSPVGMHIFRSEETVLTINNTADTLILDVTQTSIGNGVFCPRFVNCYESASFDASFTLRAAQLADGHELEISTPQTFVNENGLELRFDRGTLDVVADDGSTMTVEADNGDPSSVTVTTVTSDNISSSFDLPWSDMREYLERLR